MVIQTVSFQWLFNNVTAQLSYFATGDYFATCCSIRNNDCINSTGLPLCIGGCPGGNQRVNVYITLNDGTEWTSIHDEVRIR